MKAAICFLSWNRIEYNKKSIESILKNTNRKDYDLIWWDNQSTDNGMIDWIRNVCKENNFYYMFFDKNYGLTIAMNNQMKIMNNMGQYDVFCHIANDIVVPHGWLDAVFQAIDTKRVGAVGINLEFTEFEKVNVDGVELEKIKREGNLCGAHFCVAQWVWKLLNEGFRHVDLGYGQQDANESLRIRCIPKEFLPKQSLDVYYLPLSKYKGEDLGGTGKIYDDYQKTIEHRLRATGSDHIGGRSYRSWIDLNYGYYCRGKITAQQMMNVLRDNYFVLFEISHLKETNIEQKFYETKFLYPNSL
jgi:hypothetical protein